MNLKLILCTLSLVALANVALGQLDRSKMPGPGPAPAIAFPDYTVEATANGIRVIVVRNTKLPTVSMRMLIDRKPAIEGEYAGVIDLAGQLMRSGTKTKTKDQIDEEVDRIGASLGSGGTSVYASGLSKYTEKLFDLMSDVALHPSFPQDELDKLIMQTKSGIKHRRMEPDAVVGMVRQKVLYGPTHPYGEVETEESIGKITRAKCLEVYNTYFKPNYAILAVVGDVDKAQVMKLAAKYFGKWKKGKIPSPVYSTPKPLDGTMVALVDRPSSVQSVIRVAQTVDLQRTSPDVVKVSVMNTVLGGGVFRLFMNLREKHAFTYGAYSAMGPDELIGAFTVYTSVRNAVTDSAVTEVFNEIRRIRDEVVDAKELQMAKNYMSGSFVRSLEDADQVAGYAIEIERYKLPKDYYRTWLKRVEGVSADEVQQVAKKYLIPDKMLVAVVGTAAEVKEKLAAFGPVKMYDEDGNPVVEKPVTAVTMKAEDIFSKFIEKTGGKAKIDAMKDRTVEMSGKMQNFTIKIKSVQKAPNKIYQEFALVGMMEQKSAYDGEKGWATGPQGVQDLEGPQLESMKVDGTMNFYGQYKDLAYTAEVTGVKNVNGKECYEVTFTKAAGSTLRHYFDTKDFLKYREVTVLTTPQGPMEQSVDMSDYKDFNGYLMPTKYSQNAMGQSMDLTVDKFDANTGVDDKIFARPSGK
ncbi:MAG TPA: insulinase family protein [Bacteroidota bacterium]